MKNLMKENYNSIHFIEFIENNLSLEPYEYFGDINEIFGIAVSPTIVLYYNADILMRVEYKIKGNVIENL